MNSEVKTTPVGLAISELPKMRAGFVYTPLRVLREWPLAGYPTLSRFYTCGSDPLRINFRFTQMNNCNFRSRCCVFYLMVSGLISVPPFEEIETTVKNILARVLDFLRASKATQVNASILAQLFVCLSESGKPL